MKNIQNLSVAIVYDRINTTFGGAEIVLRAISKLFPDAPIFTSVYHSIKADWAKDNQIIPTFLQKLPWVKDKHQLLLPLMPLAFESLDLSKYDLIISVTSAEAKGVLTRPNQLHICYMLTPSRYLYSHQNQYLKSRWYLNLPIINMIANLVLKYIKFWDITAATRPDVIIPISNLVAKRIKQFYQRIPEKVIYPPHEIKLTQTEIDKIDYFTDTQKFYLSLSRLVDYKKVDLSIEACKKLAKPLIVVGQGEAKPKLHKLAGKHACLKQEQETLEHFVKRATQENKLIWFTGHLDQTDVFKLLKNCEAVLMPGQEDFGITALEAGIFGKPVILFYTSGVAEIIQDTQHCIKIRKESVSEMIYALGKLESLNFSAHEIRQNALKYNKSKFQQELENKIEQELKGHYVVS
jgi:glycosyltransferase involved in cell wall biosynthesis